MRWKQGAYSSPGVYLEEIGPGQAGVLPTGVPAFLGFPDPTVPLTDPDPYVPKLITRWPEFEVQFGVPWLMEVDGEKRLGSYLWYAVRGFFQNGGERCYIALLAAPDPAALEDALERIEPINDIDLVCFPDLFSAGVDLRRWRPESPKTGSLSPKQIGDVQTTLVRHCTSFGGRMALLDTLPSSEFSRRSEMKLGGECPWEYASRLWSEVDGADGAIYYPWVKVQSQDENGTIAVPPCGHVAGVIARTDRERGVHKAPANEVVRGVVDLDHLVTTAEQDFLNPKGINCIRSFPGRGIRIWGARTVSAHSEWRYVNVRRIFLTAMRWLHKYGWVVAFEPNTPRLQRAVERELTAYFNSQFRRGALKGRTPEEAFYVRCRPENNPQSLGDEGKLLTEIGLALSAPLEFVVVRLIFGATGVEIEGPVAATQLT